MVKQKTIWNRGFVFSGATLIILIVVIVTGNYLFLSSRMYESGINQVMLIDAVMNVYEDIRGVVILNANNIAQDCVEETVGGGCVISSSQLQTMIEDRIDQAFQDSNTLLSNQGITVTKGVLTVTASSGGDPCQASATVDLDFTVSTSDNSIKKTCHVDGPAAA